MEYVFVEPIKGFLHPAQRKRQIHSQVAGTMEHPAVLQGNAHIPGSMLHIFDGFAMGTTPFSAVQKQHISALRAADSDPFKVLFDIITGEIHISGNDLPQFVHPFIARILVCADQSIHTQQVLGIIVAEGGFLFNSFPKPLIIDDGVAAHKTCQIEGLAGGVHGHSTHLCVFADRLGQ